MKKILISLLALMAILPASADCDFTFSSVTNDTLWVHPSAYNFFSRDTLCAHFDGRLDNWDIVLALPNGMSIFSVSQVGSGMNIPYDSINGNSCTCYAPLYWNQTVSGRDSLSSSITLPGYWDPDNDGVYESYGTVKWDAGNHKMVRFIFEFDTSFKVDTVNTITISGMLSSTSDQRGGTISETTFSKTLFVYMGYKRGDVNGDGRVNIADLADLEDHILNHTHLDDFQLKAADVDGNDVVDFCDVTALIDLLISMGVVAFPDPTI